MNYTHAASRCSVNTDLADSSEDAGVGHHLQEKSRLATLNWFYFLSNQKL